MEPLLIAIIFLVVSMLLLSVVIRGAIDSSKLTKQMVELNEEMRLLRKDIQNSKHIVDKRV
ncbi:hypothetical protein FHS16_002273 [Paenibacillus endophyticus]|uniref:Uncharacterized protein n=1 Tax=Paenibacillus endophyticus TaxID=1294268 RepID=A0A7W5C775_9BACL|nr:hypothetical protein [Paenibacillus endophyticus]MBB3152227.1 hypothetical protein [Paenibacillus endophyticus]